MGLTDWLHRNEAFSQSDRVLRDVRATRFIIYLPNSFCTCLASMSISMLTRSPGRMRPSVVTARVWGISMTEKPSGPTSTRVRLTPSTAIEPLETRSGVQLGSISKARNSHSPSGRRSRRTGGRVDMALDEMASQAVAHFQGPLEVDTIAGSPIAQVGSGQGLGPGLDLEAGAGDCDDRQAAAVDRHALAQFQRLAAGQIPPVDRQAAARLSSTTRSTRPSPSTNPVNTSRLPRCSSADTRVRTTRLDLALW